MVPSPPRDGSSPTWEPDFKTVAPAPMPKPFYNIHQKTLPRTTVQRCKNIVTSLNTHSQLCSRVHKNPIFRPWYVCAHTQTLTHTPLFRLLFLENHQTKTLQPFTSAHLFYHPENRNSSSCDKSISHGLAAKYRAQLLSSLKPLKTMYLSFTYNLPL